MNSLPTKQAGLQQSERHKQSFLTLCGGRMTKVAGRAASYAPSQSHAVSLGTVVSALALAGLVFSAGNAQAGDCNATPPGSGDWECVGSANSTGDTTVSIFGGDLDVIAPNDFGLDVSTGDALKITTYGGAVEFIGGSGVSITGLNKGVELKVGPGTIPIPDHASIIFESGGHIEGVTSDAIHVVGFSDLGVDVDITVEDLTGGQDGVEIFAGTGVVSTSTATSNLMFTATGHVEGSTGAGINIALAGDGDIGIDAGSVTGVSGISAGIFGAGDIDLHTTGDVTSSGPGGDPNQPTQGIYASVASGGNITIDAGANVSGFEAGIEAVTGAGTGNVKISAVGDVTGSGGDGIEVDHDGDGTVEINTAEKVTGDGGGGILVAHDGNGTVNIDTGGDVTGGAGDGIAVKHNGEGNVNIDTAGNVTGVGGDGIDSTMALGATGNVSISAEGDVTGGTGNGIKALHYGVGNVDISAAGDVDGSGHGILGNVKSTDAMLTINTTGEVSGGTGHGIFAVGNGSNSELAITASGKISGGTGNNAAGIYIRPTGHATVTLNAGADVSAISGIAIKGFGGGNTDISANAGSEVTGEILLSGGTDNLSFNGGDFSGVTLFDGGGGSDTLSFDGSDGALNGDNVENWEFVNIDAGSTIDLSNTLVTEFVQVYTGGTLTGISGFTVTGALVNSGTLSMQDTMADDVIIVEDNYSSSGSMGGVLEVDVDFATDTSDQLVVNGDVSGITSISIADVSSGIATGNDVLVVDVGGNTDAGDFLLADGPVSSGAYAYDLGLESGSQWYLQNAGMNQTSATYDAASSILLGFADLPTLEQRVGQRQWLSIEDEQDSLAPKEGLWLRFEGDKLNYNAGNSASGYQYDRQSWGAQVGWDYSVEERDSGYWVLGLTAQYGTMGSAVTNDFGSGSIDAEGFGIGATGTWYGNNGTYFDAQAQINWLDSDYGSSAAGTLISGQSATAYALGVEVGHRFELDGRRNLIPQAQIMWGQLDSDGFTDSAGNTVGFSSANSLIGRLGLAYEYEHSEGHLSDDGTSDTEGLGQSEKTYVIGNILHQFSDTAFSMNGDNFESGNDATWAEIGLGGSISWDDEGSLFVEGSYRTSLGGDSKGSDGWGLNAGYRMSW